MKKVLIKSKGILISLMIVTVVITVSSIGITYSKYKAKTNVNVVSNTGKLVCDVSVDSKDEYIEDNERYFYINVKNNKDNNESDTDIGYILTIENENDSKGLYRYIDSYGNSNDEYVKTLEIKEHILNNYNKEERFKIRVKSESAVKTEIKYKVKINCYQKENTGIVNPYKEGILAYNIFENAKNAYIENSEDKTILSRTPKTVPAKEVSKEDERTLSLTEDDYGNSYYFRGNVQDNYLNFNEMCWRIVRIEGDGSIKLILYDKEYKCSDAVGGDNASIGKGAYGFIGDGTESSPYRFDYENTLNRDDAVRKIINDWVDKLNNKKKLKPENWCLGNRTDWYDSNGLITTNYNTEVSSEVRKRLQGSLGVQISTLKCNEIHDEKIFDAGGLLTADELVFAGSTMNDDENNWSHYLKNTKVYWWLATPSYRVDVNDYAFYCGTDGHIGGNHVSVTHPSIIPSIVLQSEIKLTGGNGTKDNAYNIE